MSEKELVRILCGSHLYGTNIEGSDEDLKTVFVPSGRNILLQRANQISSKNSEKQDLEQFPLHRFLQLVKSGQTVALDMLFAPEEFYRSEPDQEWLLMVKRRELLISKNVKSFAGYCRQQSAKYCVKADRYEAVCAAYKFLSEAYRSFDRISEIPELFEFAESNEFTEIVEIPNAQGKLIPHLSVCDSMVPVTAKVLAATQQYGRKKLDYGERVKRASSMGNKDWKALYHAIRVAEQALELLNTGHITFPRPEKEFLLEIRHGKVPYQEISDLLESNLEKIEAASAESKLRDEVDAEMLNDMIERVYRKAVRESELPLEMGL